MKRIVVLVSALLLSVTLSWGQDSQSTNTRRVGRGDKPRRDRFAAITLPPEVARLQPLSVILGQPTDKSVIANVLSAEPCEAYIEFGPASENYTHKTDIVNLLAGIPAEVPLNNLDGDKQYFYRLLHRKTGYTAFAAEPEHSFHTQRAPGRTFTFEIHGDSHPERPQQFDPVLYAQTLLAAEVDRPDFYMTIGDDFSVDTLRNATAGAVNKIYLNQRLFLGLVARSAPVFLVNGNHEQAALCNLDGTANNVAVWAQNARNTFFSQPAPGAFYTGDKSSIEYIGLLRDYYAWTWGDALFVVIDPYWHSSKPVDNVYGGGPKSRDMWAITLGDEQYQWLKNTLESSKAKFKFVFTHHVLGTGRGGIEEAGLFEWGGKDRKDRDDFAAKRPGWELPIHQLMAKNGVTIFFQGHDHVFVWQSLDNVIYQTLPEPADPNYALYNKDAYRSGDVLPNSGRVRVTVSPDKVHVEYVRSYLPKDATAEHPNGEVAFAYDVPSSGTNVFADAKVRELANGFEFTEGPAMDKQGNVFFSDVHAGKTYKWSTDGKASLFRENTGNANGLAYDKEGNLLACETATGRIVSIDPKGDITAVADKYDGKRFNQTNDLWIDPKGGVYFSDPIYGRAEKTQGGEHVYYVTPDRKKIIRVIDDMVRPNGLAGTPDGKTIYVADQGAGKTYRYAINDDGTLRDKTLFVARGADGLKLDCHGNAYLIDNGVWIYDKSGKQIAEIDIPVPPTNLCFTSADCRTLFVTARTSIYLVSFPTSKPEQNR